MCNSSDHSLYHPDRRSATIHWPIEVSSCSRNASSTIIRMALKTLDDIEAELQNDIKVKVAGVDADGVMRGKVMAKDKFLSAAKSGFGFCRCTPAGSFIC
jgi:hypothetical protein